ncbi:hypothetical protein KAR91_37170 [Candidatus Pacearchaeota archaeon]|nr:hypothetical protein [Candidatus Pacearchaeota archaeon]
MKWKNSWRSSIFIVLIWFVLLLAGCGSGGSGGGSDSPPAVGLSTVITFSDDGTETTSTTTITGDDGTISVFVVTRKTEDDSVIVSSMTVTEIDGTITETVTYPDGSRFETVIEPDGTVTETVTDEVTDGDGITLERVAVTVVKPDGEKIRTVMTTDPDGVETVITTNSKEFSVSSFNVVHSLDPQLDGQVFDKVTAIIEFTNDSSEPVLIAESYFEVGTCGGPYTDVDVYEFGYTDYNNGILAGVVTEEGPYSAPLYRRLTTGLSGPCDLYGDGHRVKFIVETYINDEVVIILEAETSFTVAPAV